MQKSSLSLNVREIDKQDGGDEHREGGDGNLGGPDDCDDGRGGDGDGGGGGRGRGGATVVVVVPEEVAVVPCTRVAYSLRSSLRST